MDQIDRNILQILQEDVTLSVAEIAKRVSLSTTPCWRRIQNLEKTGVIRKKVALVDAAKVNLGITVFVRLRTTRHSKDWFERFSRAVEEIDEVVEFYRLSGEIDYLLRVVVPDIAGYDEVYKRLIASAELSDVSASFVMGTIKHTTALPLHYV
jgi:Lrp/AsnC family transcriptional regulator